MFDYCRVEPGSPFEQEHGLAEITIHRIFKRNPYYVAIDTTRRFVVYVVRRGDPIGGDEYDVTYGLYLAGLSLVAHCTTEPEEIGGSSAWRFKDKGLIIPPDAAYSRAFVIEILKEAMEARLRHLGVTDADQYSFQ